MSTDFHHSLAAVRSVLNATPEQVAELQRVAEAVADPAEAGHGFAAGGRVHGPRWGCYLTAVHPDECLISAENVKAGRFTCSRPGHPTGTSDCSKGAH